MPKPCSEAGCPNPSRARGLCQGHYTLRWRAGELPRKSRREVLVRHKLALTREQTISVRKLSVEKGQTLSAFLRLIISDYLEKAQADAPVTEK